jgi:hypothetical protein
MNGKGFLFWASHRFQGHVVISFLMFGGPLLVFWLATDYTDGTLSWLGAIYWTSRAVTGSFVFATLFWFTVSRPLIGQKDKK